MTPEQRASLRTYVDALAPGAPISLPREWVQELLDGSPTAHPVGPDLTVEEVANRYGRAASTVRTWILAGHLKAYRHMGREHRITPAALAEFEATQRAAGKGAPGQRKPRPRLATKPVDLAAYREAS